MNDFDHGARHAVRLEPEGTKCFLTLADLAVVFARLTDSEYVWKKGPEGIMVK